MKDFKIISSTFLVFCLLTTNCKKEAQELVDFLRIDSNDKTIMQKDLNILVNFSVFGNDNQYFELDINNDLVADIGFNCAHVKGPVSVYSYGGSSILALNKSIEFDVEKKNYPIANYSTTYIDKENQSTVTIYSRENFILGKDYPNNLKIDTIQCESPKIHEIGDTINSSSIWKSGCYILTHHDNLVGYSTKNIKTGTWENLSEKFIGIRLSENNRYYYGWIQLSVTGYEYRIQLYKLGLQQ